MRKALAAAVAVVAVAAVSTIAVAQSTQRFSDVRTILTSPRSTGLPTLG